MRRCHKKIGKTTTATAENFRLGKQFPSRRPATISPAERCRGGKTLFLLLYEKKKERPTFYYVGKFTVRLAASNRCAVNKPLTFLPSVLSSVPLLLSFSLFMRYRTIIIKPPFFQYSPNDKSVRAYPLRFS